MPICPVAVQVVKGVEKGNLPHLSLSHHYSIITGTLLTVTVTLLLVSQPCHYHHQFLLPTQTCTDPRTTKCTIISGCDLVALCNVSDSQITAQDKYWFNILVSSIKPKSPDNRPQSYDNRFKVQGGVQVIRHFAPTIKQVALDTRGRPQCVCEANLVNSQFQPPLRRQATHSCPTWQLPFFFCQCATTYYASTVLGK